MLSIEFPLNVTFCDPFLGNAIGSYTLQSAIQKLQGPRLFHSFFGFLYKCSNSKVTVTISTESASVVLLQPDSCTGWTYLSKNLSSIINNWSEGQEFQVSLGSYWSIFIIISILLIDGSRQANSLEKNPALMYRHETHSK